MFVYTKQLALFGCHNANKNKIKIKEKKHKTEDLHKMTKYQKMNNKLREARNVLYPE